jgi:hypothetical protein
MATTDHADDLVPFRNVTVISSTGTALLCLVGGKSVWLPRRHISGRLRCMGDRGTLLIRRWIARDRRLLRPLGTAAVSALGRSMSLRRLAAPLHLVRRDRGMHLPTRRNEIEPGGAEGRVP